MGDQGESALEKLSSYYAEELRLFGPENSKVVSIPLVDGQTTAHTVVEYVNEICDPAPNFICLAPRARIGEHEELSSISNGIISGAKCNIFLLKDK